ncbi:glycosyltransferase family 39 protein [Candidatus Saccharibacteria bacterium]|nr:glycosyltransferase family 39 protein [Candidatus Saccharibacteria bacterium]MBR3378053.1 glycosyltransferase family 39 protein [Candidatus Saccharibacteria bacterium]
MKKRTKQFFLYRHCIGLGYFLLGIVFIALLTFLPTVAPDGLTEQEMNSTITASNLETNFMQTGNIIDLPYHALQKTSLHFFGLSIWSIKLPSVIIAIFTAFFIILLLNRWFKNDVAIVASILTTLSTAFLFLAGNGTPAIMYIFWLSLTLWLGSKIVGNDHVHPLLVISFFLSLALSSYTPHLLFITIAIAVAGIIHPHLRFGLKQLSFWQLILSFGIFFLAISPLVVGCIVKPENIQQLLFMKDFSFGSFIQNISNAFAPFFSFSLVYNSIYLAPLFGLATVVIVIIGVLASVGKMFTSRNTVVSLLVIYAIFVSGFNGDVAISIIIPIAVMTAAGVESIVEKWYSLFPENPYAHLFGIVPMVIVMGMIIISSQTHFVFGYHYAPRVVDNFNDDLIVISGHIDTKTPILINDETEHADFYRLLPKYTDYEIIDRVHSDTTEYATFKPVKAEKFALKEIITSPKSRNSDRLYIYSKDTDNKGE